MTLHIRRPFQVMLLLIVLAAGAATAAVYTSFFHLKKIRIEPEVYSSALNGISLNQGQNILLAPLDEAVTYLMTIPWITKVQIDYDLPDGLVIRLNDVTPEALTLGADGSTIYGIDGRDRLIPYKKGIAKYELPLITGLKCPPMYQRPEDPRLGIIMRQVRQLKEKHQDFYQILSAIDLSSPDSVIVYMDGLPFHMVMFAGGLYRAVEDLKKLLLEYKPDMREIKWLDFRAEGQIIAMKATKKACPKKGS